jgi:hypothetical protein
LTEGLVLVGPRVGVGWFSFGHGLFGSLGVGLDGDLWVFFSLPRRAGRIQGV